MNSFYILRWSTITVIQSCAVEVIAYPRVLFDHLLPVRGWQWRFMRGATPLAQLLRGLAQVAAV